MELEIKVPVNTNQVYYVTERNEENRDCVNFFVVNFFSFVIFGYILFKSNEAEGFIFPLRCIVKTKTNKQKN